MTGVVIRMKENGDVTDIYPVHNVFTEGFSCFDCNGDLVWTVPFELNAYISEEKKKKAIKIVDEKRKQILTRGLWGKIPSRRNWKGIGWECTEKQWYELLADWGRECPGHVPELKRLYSKIKKENRNE